MTRRETHPRAPGGPKTAGRRGPGQRAGLVREAILEAARSISEREGVARLTMRRLADRLGVAPNALYSHFPNKSALLDAVLDSLLAGIEVPEVERVDWKRGLFVLMSEARRLLRAHIELIPLFLSRPSRGPNAMRLGEVTLAFLARAGLRGPAAVDALRVLLIYSLGFAAHEAPRRNDPAPEKRRALSEAAFRGAPDLPHVRELAGELARHPDDETFEMGLRWLIAGIEDAARQCSAPDAPAPSAVRPRGGTER